MDLLRREAVIACADRKVGRAWSFGVSVFVDEAVASAGSENGDRCWWRVWWVVDGCRWLLFERLVGRCWLWWLM